MSKSSAVCYVCQAVASNCQIADHNEGIVDDIRLDGIDVFNVRAMDMTTYKLATPEQASDEPLVESFIKDKQAHQHVVVCVPKGSDVSLLMAKGFALCQLYSFTDYICLMLGCSH